MKNKNNYCGLLKKKRLAFVHNVFWQFDCVCNRLISCASTMVDKPYKQSALRVAVKTEPVDVAEMNSEYEASPAADFLASLATFDHSYYCASGIYPSYSVTANSSFTAFSSIESQPTAAPLESLPAATSNESQPATAVNPVANENSIACDNYEYPREYFIALIDDAQIRYDHALEFFQGMRTYSPKCEVYVTILQDIFVELGKPPATLEPEVYRRLAKLRRCIRHLELKLSSRRPRVVNHPASSLDNVAVKAELCDKATQTDGSYEDSQAKRKALEEFHSQQLPWYELKAKENLEQKIHDLAMKEKRLRDERRGVESELRLQFGSWSGPSEYSAESTSRLKNNFDCVFCGKHNRGYICWNKPTLEERILFFQAHKICHYCGKPHSGHCQIASLVVCAWPQCGAKGDHNSALCPYADYPITMAKVLSLKASKCNAAKTRWFSESVENETSTSKSLSMDVKKRAVKRVAVTVVREPASKCQCRSLPDPPEMTSSKMNL